MKPVSAITRWLMLGMLWLGLLPTNPALAPATAVPRPAPEYRYTGEQIDPDLGMYYLRARYYQPATGRFWNMDSFEGRQNEPLSLHKYLYCHGNPVNAVDPSGHDLIGSFSAMSISAQIAAVNFMAAYGAMAETAVFVTGVSMLNSARLLSTGIDPETGESATGMATVFAVVDFLPAGKFITRPIKGRAGEVWREAARNIWDALSKISRQEHQVHHRIPLEWAHLFPNMNPNRIGNLKLVPETIHNGPQGVTSAWRQFKQQLSGRTPTAEEVESFARQIDQQFGQHFHSLN